MKKTPEIISVLQCTKCGRIVMEKDYAESCATRCGHRGSDVLREAPGVFLNWRMRFVIKVLLPLGIRPKIKMSKYKYNHKPVANEG